MNISRRGLLKSAGAAIAASATQTTFAAEPTRGISTPDHGYNQQGATVHRRALPKAGLKSANDVFVSVTYENSKVEGNAIDSANLVVNAKNSNIISGTIAYGNAQYYIQTNSDGSHNVINQTREGLKLSGKAASDVVERARDLATGGSMAPLPSADQLFSEVRKATRAAPGLTPGR